MALLTNSDIKISRDIKKEKYEKPNGEHKRKLYL